MTMDWIDQSTKELRILDLDQESEPLHSVLVGRGLRSDGISIETYTTAGGKRGDGGRRG